LVWRWKLGVVLVPESSVLSKSLAFCACATVATSALASAMSPSDTREHERKLGTLAPCWRPHEKFG